MVRPHPAAAVEHFVAPPRAVPRLQDPALGQQVAVDGRVEHDVIDRVAPQRTGPDRRGHGRRVDQVSPCDVDHERVGRQLVELHGADHRWRPEAVAGADQQRVGVGQQPVTGGHGDACVPGGARCREARVVSEHPHAEGGTELGDPRADPADPHHAHRAAGQLDPAQRRLRRCGAAAAVVCEVQPCRHAEQHRDGVLGDRVGRVVREDGQSDATRREQGDVDVVVAGRVQHDGAQVGERVEQRGIQRRQAGVGRGEDVGAAQQVDGVIVIRRIVQLVVADVSQPLQPHHVVPRQGLGALPTEHRHGCHTPLRIASVLFGSSVVHACDALRGAVTSPCVPSDEATGLTACQSIRVLHWI